MTIICDFENLSGLCKLICLTTTTFIIIPRTVSWNAPVPVIYLIWQVSRIVMQYFDKTRLSNVIIDHTSGSNKSSPLKVVLMEEDNIG